MVNLIPASDVPTLDEVRERIKSNLNLIQAIYGISFVLGLRVLAEALPYESINWARDSLLIFAAIALFLVSVRFYFAVGNIRRRLLSYYEAAAVRVRASELQGEEALARLCAELAGELRRAICLDLLVLVLQSFVFYILCRMVAGLWSLDGAAELPIHLVHRFVALFAILLLINAVWIRTLKTSGNKGSAEFFWMKNNGLFGAFCLVWVVVNWFVGFAPSFLPMEFFLGIPILAFLCNSGLDLWLTYWAYLTELNYRERRTPATGERGQSPSGVGGTQTAGTTA